MIKDTLCQSFLTLPLFFFLTSPTFGASASFDETILEKQSQETQETENLWSQALETGKYTEQTAQENLGIILASDSNDYASYDYRAKQVSAGKLLKTSVIASLFTTLSWVLLIASAADGSSGSIVLGLVVVISTITAWVSNLLGTWQLGDLLTSERYFLQNTEIKPTKIRHSFINHLRLVDDPLAGS